MSASTTDFTLESTGETEAYDTSFQTQEDTGPTPPKTFEGAFVGDSVQVKSFEYEAYKPPGIQTFEADFVDANVRTRRHQGVRFGAFETVSITVAGGSTDQTFADAGISTGVTVNGFEAGVEAHEIGVATLDTAVGTALDDQHNYQQPLTPETTFAAVVTDDTEQILPIMFEPTEVINAGVSPPFEFTGIARGEIYDYVSLTAFESDINPIGGVQELQLEPASERTEAFGIDIVSDDVSIFERPTTDSHEYVLQQAPIAVIDNNPAIAKASGVDIVSNEFAFLERPEHDIYTLAPLSANVSSPGTDRKQFFTMSQVLAFSESFGYPVVNIYPLIYLRGEIIVGYVPVDAPEGLWLRNGIKSGRSGSWSAKGDPSAGISL